MALSITTGGYVSIYRWLCQYLEVAMLVSRGGYILSTVGCVCYVFNSPPTVFISSNFAVSVTVSVHLLRCNAYTAGDVEKGIRGNSLPVGSLPVGSCSAASVSWTKHQWLVVMVGLQCSRSGRDM